MSEQAETWLSRGVVRPVSAGGDVAVDMAIDEPEVVAPLAPPSHLRVFNPAPFYRSLGLALLIEIVVMAAVVWGINRSGVPALAKVPTRIQVHIVTPPSPLPPPRVQQFAPAHINPSPIVATPHLAVIAVASYVPLLPTNFEVPAEALRPLAKPPRVPTQTVATVLAHYTAQLNAAIQLDLRVPGMVRAMHLRGVAMVTFRLTPSGALRWAKLVRSSGIPLIDAAALAKVRSSAYPPFPPALPQHDTTFRIAVRFSTAR